MNNFFIYLKERLFEIWQNNNIYTINSSEFNQYLVKQIENSLISKQYNIKFDWELYLNTYLDLKQAGICSENDAYKHWLYNGRNEQRIVMTVSTNDRVSEPFLGYNWTANDV